MITPRPLPRTWEVVGSGEKLREKVGWLSGSVLIMTAYSFCEFCKHFWGAYYVIGTVLGTGDTQMCKTLLSVLKEEIHNKERVRKLCQRPVAGYRASHMY